MFLIKLPKQWEIKQIIINRILKKSNDCIFDIKIMQIILFRLQIILGLVLIIMGILFDLVFVTTMENFSALAKKPILQKVWTKYVYETIKFYLFVFGFLNIVFAIIMQSAGLPTRIDWIIFSFMAFGSLLFFIGGLLEARGAPALEWTFACIVLIMGFLGIISGIVLEMYKIIK